MSDIIANAKQLLDGATTAPWEWVGYSLEAESSMVLDFQCVTAFGQSGALREVEVTPEDEALIAAAPDLAQALAEETWEYSYHIQNAIGMWEHLTPRAGDPERWWDTRGEAEESALAAHEYGYPIRIVRRRVSPPEVVSE